MIHLHLKGTLATPKFQLVKFTKVLKSAMEIQQRQAIRAWLRAVLSKTPTYTGTARGTYRPIARVIGKVAVRPGSISKQARAKIASGTRIQGKNYNLGFNAGGQYSDHSITQKYSKVLLRYEFIFQQDLPYAVWNDIYPAPAWITLPSNPPWHALDAGRDAWEQYMQTEAPKHVPNANQFISFKRVKVG